MTSEGGALEHVEETSKLYRETTVPVEIKQPKAGGYLRVSKHTLARNNLFCTLNWRAQVSLKISLNE